MELDLPDSASGQGRVSSAAPVGTAGCSWAAALGTAGTQALTFAAAVVPLVAYLDTKNTLPITLSQ